MAKGEMEDERRMWELLEGAMLLALDELARGNVDGARMILQTARISRSFYLRAKAANDVERLKRIVRAMEE